MRNVGDRVLLKSGTCLQEGIILHVRSRYRVLTREGETRDVEESTIVDMPVAKLTEEQIVSIGQECGAILKVYSETQRKTQKQVRTIYLVEQGFSSYLCKLSKAQLMTPQEFATLVRTKMEVM